MAYVGDSTDEEGRSRGMGILGAAIGLGTILGPGIGGLLAGDEPTRTSLALPFFIAGGLSLLSLVLIAILLPESLPAQVREDAAGEARTIGLAQVRSALRSPLGVLLGMAFLVAFALTTFYGIFGLYALEKYGYGPQEVGLVITVVSLVSAVAQGTLTGPLAERYGESAVIRATLLATAGGFALMLLADSAMMVLVFAAFFSLAAALLSPAVSAMTSVQSHLRQGITMGLSNAFGSLGRIIGPLLAGVAFDIDIHYPYVGGAIVMLLGFLASVAWLGRGSHRMVTGRDYKGPQGTERLR